MTKISALSQDTAPTTTDYVPTVDAETTTTKRVTLADLITLFFNQTNIPSGGGSPVTRDDEMFFDHVASGLVITGDSLGTNKNYSFTAGVVYINGRRLSVSAVSAATVGASKDRYIDILDNGDGTASVVNTEVSNNAASPVLASNSIRIGIVVAGATTIANSGSINQGQEDKVLPIASSIPYAVTDSLGNLICLRTPTPSIIGYRQVLSSQNITTLSDITGLNFVCKPPTGRKVKISGFSGIDNTNAGSGFRFILYDATNSVQLTEGVGNVANNGYAMNQHPMAVKTPTSSSMNYKAQGNVYGSGATVATGASSTVPIIIMAELV